MPLQVHGETIGTIVPTIETIRPVIAGHFAPVRNSATIDSTNAIGSRIHPTINAPEMQAKMKPTTATASAMMPSTFGLRFGAGSPASGITVVPGAAAA